VNTLQLNAKQIRQDTERDTNQVCLAVAETRIAERRLSLDDLERETGMRDTHKWGSDTSRRKRRAILAEFKRRVMQDVTILNKYELA
jgi:hypothetical protein